MRCCLHEKHCPAPGPGVCPLLAHIPFCPQNPSHENHYQLEALSIYRLTRKTQKERLQEDGQHRSSSSQVAIDLDRLYIYPWSVLGGVQAEVNTILPRLDDWRVRATHSSILQPHPSFHSKRGVVCSGVAASELILRSGQVATSALHDCLAPLRSDPIFW